MTIPASPLVGRDREERVLRDRLAAAVAGSGGLVLVSGPAGMGKTRLAVELAGWAAAASVPVAWSRCPQDEGAPPLWPWLRLLEGGGGGSRSVADALSEAPRGAAEAAASRFRLVDAVTRALKDTAAPEARVVIVEDLHWADETSLRVLQQLAGEVAESRLLAVATYRDAAAGSAAFAEVLTDVSRQRNVTSLALEPLDEDGVAACLSAVTAQAVTRELARAVRERTGGRPLLVQVAGTMLGASPEPGTAGPQLWRRVAAAADVRRMVDSSVAALTPDARGTVRTAALIGEDVEPAFVGAVSEASVEDTVRHLEQAVASGLLTRSGPDGLGYRFAHELVRDAVAATVDAGTRMRRHRDAARLLEERATADPVVGAEAARHWLAAGADPSTLLRAVAATRRSASAASRRFANADAARLLRTALSAAERAGADPGLRAEILVQLAEADFLAGDVRGSCAQCIAAADAATDAGRHDLVAASALVIQGVQDEQVLRTNERLCEAALNLPGLGNAVRARLLAQLACTYADGGLAPGRVGPLSEQALELAEASGDDRAVLDALRARDLVLASPGMAAERLQLGQAAVRRATAAGQPTAALWGHLWRADAAFTLGRLDTLADAAAQIERLADSGLTLARWHHLRLQASLATLRGEFDAAIAMSHAAGRLAQQMGDFSGVSMTWAHLESVAMLRGTPDLVPEGVMHDITEAPPVPIVLGATALLHLLKDDLDEARTTYERLIPALTTPERDARWAGVVSMLVQLCEAFDDADTAARLHQELRPYAAHGGGLGTASVVYTGAVARDLGRTAAVAGRSDEAAQWLREAVVVNTRMGARPFVAMSRVELAGVLHRTGEARDRPEARELVRQAAREFRRLGMPGPLARADVLTAQLEAAERAADPLSTREREIAGLVAEALTNRQIADRLFLSERTVESHVRNILGKLDFTTRTEIATWAVRR